MKDSISIIFATMILSFLIIMLPLISILDRQDSMSYNVVLTQTTNFVDEIRGNGFLTSEAYNNYISSLSSTGNTYKVVLQAYKKTLIPATDAKGKVIANSYVEERELYNTKDITDFLEGSRVNDEVNNSNIRDNIYLFNENDEIYVTVYNTNLTPGTVMYSSLIGSVDPKVIDITYGGVVNNVNWELYTKLKSETIAYPEVTLSVPTNVENKINVKKLVDDSEMKNVKCEVEGLDDIFAGVYELCTDITKEDTYAYIYNLDEQNEEGIKVNKTIRFALDFTDVEEIKVSDYEYVPLNNLIADNYLKGEPGSQSTQENYIINNFIQLNGMKANIDLKAENNKIYIVLTDVDMVSLANISAIVSLAIHPGLGRNYLQVPTLGTESVKIQLTNRSEAKTTAILGPYNWKKFLKTEIAEEAKITDSSVYLKQEVFFKIQYTGVKNTSQEEVLNLIKENISYNRELAVNDIQEEIVQVTYFTPRQMLEEYGLIVETDSIIAKVIYPRTAVSRLSGKHYLTLKEGWYTNMPKMSSEIFWLYEDAGVPTAPTIAFDGTLGTNGWYTSAVQIYVTSGIDKISSTKTGGSGIYRNLLTVNGPTNIVDKDADEETIITTDGIHNVYATSEDHVGNISDKSYLQLKIDKVSPTTPKIKISGSKGTDDWYVSNVTINIEEGKDYGSGVARTTYEVQGSQAIAETTGKLVTLNKSGIYTVIATTYDNAGNKSSEIVSIKVDKGDPPEVTFDVVNGLKHDLGTDEENEWYYTDVKVKINVHLTGATTQSKTSRYQVIGPNPKASSTFIGENKEVIISGNGTHELRVTTYTVAGTSRQTSYFVKIDKDAPNNPTVTIKGDKIIDDSEWYTSNVTVQVTLGGDVGTSGELPFDYKITNGSNVIQKTNISSGTTITISREGVNHLAITTRDNAGNEMIHDEYIKIDKTLPTSANFVIDGEEGTNDWYITDVYLTYSGEQDKISGINRVEISKMALVQDTEGTEVTMTTYDNAGHKVETKKTIKIDKVAPTAPVFNMPEQIDHDLQGVYVYNKTTTISITPGADSNGSVKSGYAKTTYMVTKDGADYRNETTGTSVRLTESGFYSITARTYDKAGNVSLSSVVVLIDKNPPQAPKIAMVNGEYVGDTSSLSGTLSSVSVTVDGFNSEYITMTISGPGGTYTDTSTSASISAILTGGYGTYSIRITQTNMYGLTSSAATFTYRYKSE